MRHYLHVVLASSADGEEKLLLGIHHVVIEPDVVMRGIGQRQVIRDIADD